MFHAVLMMITTTVKKTVIENKMISCMRQPRYDVNCFSTLSMTVDLT